MGKEQGSGRATRQQDELGAAVNVSMLAQVTAAVVAVIRADEAGCPADSTSNPGHHKGDETQPYNKFQLAKLKGFCCLCSLSSLPLIWEYFKTTEDVDAQQTQLMESMREWAKQHDVQINRGLYFDKSTMDDIVRLEFCPGTPTAYLSTAKQGISMLICHPYTGNETANIWSKEQAIHLTSKNTPWQRRSSWG
jgi:hypothetical protein